MLSHLILESTLIIKTSQYLYYIDNMFTFAYIVILPVRLKRALAYKMNIKNSYNYF